MTVSEVSFEVWIAMLLNRTVNNSDSFSFHHLLELVRADKLYRAAVFNHVIVSINIRILSIFITNDGGN